MYLSICATVFVKDSVVQKHLRLSHHNVVPPAIFPLRAVRENNLKPFLPPFLFKILNAYVLLVVCDMCMESMESVCNCNLYFHLYLYSVSVGATVALPEKVETICGSVECLPNGTLLEEMRMHKYKYKYKYKNKCKYKC